MKREFDEGQKAFAGENALMRDKNDKTDMKANGLFMTLIALTYSLTIVGKTTYIPTYRSYIHIVYGTDTVSIDGSLSELEMEEANGLFTIRFEHEEVTQEKVKAIKRAKRAAGFAAFRAVMSGVSTVFSSNSLQYYIRSINAKVSADLASIYRTNAEEEQKLNIDLWIDNPTDSELMVNDMERGLTWYVLPKQSMQLKVNNPEAARLRISDVHNSFVRYVTAVAGSSVKMLEVDWEDDECWIVAVYKLQTKAPSEVTYTVRKPVRPMGPLNYRLISKRDFTEGEMTEDEFLAYKKARKQESVKK